MLTWNIFVIGVVLLFAVGSTPGESNKLSFSWPPSPTALPMRGRGVVHVPIQAPVGHVGHVDSLVSKFGGKTAPRSHVKKLVENFGGRGRKPTRTQQVGNRPIEQYDRKYRTESRTSEDRPSQTHVGDLAEKFRDGGFFKNVRPIKDNLDLAKKLKGSVRGRQWPPSTKNEKPNKNTLDEDLGYLSPVRGRQWPPSSARAAAQVLPPVEVDEEPTTLEASPEAAVNSSPNLSEDDLSMAPAEPTVNHSEQTPDDLPADLSDDDYKQTVADQPEDLPEAAADSSPVLSDDDSEQTRVDPPTNLSEDDSPTVASEASVNSSPGLSEDDSEQTSFDLVPADLPGDDIPTAPSEAAVDSSPVLSEDDLPTDLPEDDSEQTSFDLVPTDLPEDYIPTAPSEAAVDSSPVLSEDDLPTDLSDDESGQTLVNPSINLSEDNSKQAVVDQAEDFLEGESPNKSPEAPVASNQVSPLSDEEVDDLSPSDQTDHLPPLPESATESEQDQLSPEYEDEATQTSQFEE